MILTKFLMLKRGRSLLAYKPVIYKLKIESG